MDCIEDKGGGRGEITTLMDRRMGKERREREDGRQVKEWSDNGWRMK